EMKQEDNFSVVADAVGFEPVSPCNLGICREILPKCRETVSETRLKTVRCHRLGCGSPYSDSRDSAKGQRRKSFQGLLGRQIGHWRSRYRVFDHRGGRRGPRLDPDIIGEAKPTAAHSAADLSAPKRGMCRRPANRSAVNHL